MKRSIVLCLLSCWAFATAAQSAPNEIRAARGNEDYPPNEMHVDGKLTGLHVEMMEAVAAKMGMKLVWVELPWPRAQKCAEDGECNLISYISPSPEREQWGIFLPGNVLSQVNMHFMIHKDNKDKITFNGKAETILREKTLLTLIAYNYGPEVAKAKKYEVKDLSTMANMISDKRYDVAVISADDFIGIKSHPELMLLNPPVWTSKSFVAFSKKANTTSDLAGKFQAAYAEFKKTKEYSAIINRYKVNAK